MEMTGARSQRGNASPDILFQRISLGKAWKPSSAGIFTCAFPYIFQIGPPSRIRSVTDCPRVFPRSRIFLQGRRSILANSHGSNERLHHAASSYKLSISFSLALVFCRKFTLVWLNTGQCYGYTCHNCVSERWILKSGLANCVNGSCVDFRTLDAIRSRRRFDFLIEFPRER